jgi:hypothetical protein
MRAGLGGAVLSAALILIGAAQSQAITIPTCEVSSSSDPGSGSLREAISGLDSGACIGPIEIVSGLGRITLAGDLPAITQSVTISGNGNTIDGAGEYRGLFVYGLGADGASPQGITVAIDDLTIQNARAIGGSGGGGGAGLGGALFVSAGASASLNGVSFTDDSAVGGAGNSDPGDGGGGLGGDGGDGSPVGCPDTDASSGGGGVGVGAAGADCTGVSGAGIVVGADAGGSYEAFPGGADGGGGAAAPAAQGDSTFIGTGGGIDGGSANDVSQSAGEGGFGGGGGGSVDGTSGDGGFGGGGGEVGTDVPPETGETGGTGGFGGGGAGNSDPGGTPGAGGFGGGAGANDDGSGGGLGAGGGIFVQHGGSLSIDGSLTETGGSARRGVASGDAGAGHVRLDDEIADVRTLDAIRIAPEVVRAFEAGPDGLELLVFGRHHEADGEQVEDAWVE